MCFHLFNKQKPNVLNNINDNNNNNNNNNE